MDSDGKGGWKVPSRKGQRLIVVYAGGVEGWVEVLTWCLNQRRTQLTTTMK